MPRFSRWSGTAQGFESRLPSLCPSSGSALLKSGSVPGRLRDTGRVMRSARPVGQCTLTESQRCARPRRRSILRGRASHHRPSLLGYSEYKLFVPLKNHMVPRSIPISDVFGLISHIVCFLNLLLGLQQGESQAFLLGNHPGSVLSLLHAAVDANLPVL